MAKRAPRSLPRGHGRVLRERRAAGENGSEQQARDRRGGPEERNGSRRRPGVPVRGPGGGKPKRGAHWHGLGGGADGPVPPPPPRTIRAGPGGSGVQTP